MEEPEEQAAGLEPISQPPDDQDDLIAGIERVTVGEREGDREDPEVVCLVDARNGFNTLNRKAMLWHVRHRWPMGARYAFNCYRYAAQLIVRRPGAEGLVILSREG